MGTTESRTPLTTVPLSPARHLPTEASIHKCVYTVWVSFYASFTGAKSTKEEAWGQADTALQLAPTALVWHTES